MTARNTIFYNHTGLPCSCRRTGRFVLGILLLLLLSRSGSFATDVPGGRETGKTEYEKEFEAGLPPYDEISVFLNVQRVGGTELPALIRNQDVYLPVSAVFDFLKIKSSTSADLDSVTGFFIQPQDAFVIDYEHKLLHYHGKTLELQNGLIRTESNLYLKLEYFSQVFGLDCSFDFRNLSVKVNTALELPVIREMKQDLIRRNISRLNGQEKADTSVGRSYPLFYIGTADWSVISMQEQQGRTDTRASVAIGSVVAGGEMNVTLNYFSNMPVTHRQQYYQWRYANNEHRALRQVMLGKIAPQSTSSIFDPVVGVQLTNSPTSFRRSFGSYNLSDMTQPGWVVELYVNNVLVDYTQADASGFYSFNVPLVYGNSVVKLRFYSPWGEERTRVENISIPFNFIPKNELEYTVSAGMVEDGQQSRYARASAGYGLTRSLTVGGGMEYLSSVASGNKMPFLNASLRISSGLLLSGEYTHGVRSRGILSYRLPSNLQFELNYTRYARDQRAIIFNYLEERKASLILPFRVKDIGLMSRLTLNQLVLPGMTRYTTGEWTLSGGLGCVSANVSTYLTAVSRQADPVHYEPYVYSNAALAVRLPKGFLLTPQAQYMYGQGKFISVRCGLERMVFRQGFVNITYEQNFISKINSIGAGLRYDFSFARAGFSARRVNGRLTTVQSAQGSVIHDDRTGYTAAGNRSSVGRAGITILAYLDINCNGRRDAGEPKVPGLKVQVSNGRMVYSEQDTLTRIFDLEPYTNYLVRLGTGNFETVSWQIRHRSMNITADPNQMKLIEVPVAVVGEISGRVSLKGSNDNKKGLGRIKVCIYRDDHTQVACVTTEPDGSFNYLGLPPGAYSVRPDAAQLLQLQLESTPGTLPVRIEPSAEGTMVEGLNFTLGPIPGGFVPVN